MTTDLAPRTSTRPRRLAEQSVRMEAARRVAPGAAAVLVLLLVVAALVLLLPRPTAAPKSQRYGIVKIAVDRGPEDAL